MFLRVGMKEGFIFLPLTNTQTIQTDIPGMICIQKRSGEHPHGNFFYSSQSRKYYVSGK